MSCPTCSEDGAYYRGTPYAELLHFFRRALWDCHQARLALEADGRPELARETSVIIQHLEHVTGLALSRTKA
jgi:hypothetical protein